MSWPFAVAAIATGSKGTAALCRAGASALECASTLGISAGNAVATVPATATASACVR